MVLLILTRAARRLRIHRGLGFGTILLVLCASVLGNALCFRFFDASYHDQLTFGDAVWYSVISITTIGYGDFYAQSLGARLSTIVFIVILGLTAFSAFFGMLIDVIAESFLRGQKGSGHVMAKNHILIVNFPGETRVCQIIDEFQAEASRRSEIVIIADNIEELPFRKPNVMFVRGSTHDTSTYQRANIEDAAMAIILSRDYADANSDALVAAAAGVIDKLNADIYIVAECIDHKHRPLFEAVRCNAIVPTLNIACNLMVQEAHDPGISKMVEMITSNQIGATLYSTVVDANMESGYTKVAQNLLDKGINVLAFNRCDDSHTQFFDQRPEKGDRIIYIADRRRSWGELTAMIC